MSAPLEPRPAADAPPRVLLVHNAYRYRGGEDAVVDAEEALLRQHGHAVLRYQRSNDDIAAGTSRLQLAKDTVWSARTTQDIARWVSDFRPDIVHVHNTLPLVSPSVYWAAHRAGVPVVQTLHNFRLLCPQAMLLREGRICEDCVGRVPWRAVVHRCYRDSASQSAAVAATVQVHRWAGTWQQKVTRYIALNEFCKAKFIEGGLPAERISIKPNFVDLPAPPVQPRDGLLFVGRLSQEKGLDVLARAMRQTGTAVRIRVVGSGPDRELLQGLPNADVVGPLDSQAVYAQMALASALVLPSIWYENFPRTLVEAFACGLPVIASRLGALTTLVRDGQTGLLFEAGDAADLQRKLEWATAHPAEMQAMGAAARAQYESAWTPGANYKALLAIYDQAMQR